jgi:hypothetical protein
MYGSGSTAKFAISASSSSDELEAKWVEYGWVIEGARATSEVFSTVELRFGGEILFSCASSTPSLGLS